MGRVVSAQVWVWDAAWVGIGTRLEREQGGMGGDLL